MNEVSARKFLLGDLSDEERDRIQELAFEDPETFAVIQAAHDDLLDEFANDELSPEEKERFQNYFLVQPGRREDLTIARALQQYLARDEQSGEKIADSSFKPTPRVSIFDWFLLRPVTAALVSVILAATSMFILFMRRGNMPALTQQYSTPSPAPSVSPADTPQASPAPTPTYNQGQPSPSPRQSIEPIYALLAPGGPARSEGNEQTLPPVVRQIRFELPLVDEPVYRSYHVVLQDDVRRIRTWSNRQPKKLKTGTGIEIIVPGSLLRNGQRYRFTLEVISGEKSQFIESYYFRVGN